MADVQPSSGAATGPAAGSGAKDGAPGAYGIERGASARSAQGTAPQGDTAAPGGAVPAAGDGASALKPPSTDQVKAAVKDANQALQAIGTQLVFVFDDQAHHLAVKLLDVQTQKVVQQIPGASMPAKASALAGAAPSGTLVDTKA